MNLLPNVEQDNFKGQMHIYLSFEYLPSRNFYLLSKNINELYESIFEIINNRQLTNDELLIFEDISTGNSIDILLKILEKINLSKSAWTVLGIVTTLIIAHSKYYETKKINADIALVYATTEKISEEKNLIKAQKENTLFENRKLELEAQKLEQELKTSKIDKQYMDKIFLTNNFKKINRKLKSIEKQIMNKPINTAIINGVIIYNEN